MLCTVLGVLLALTTSVLWGGSDFLGGQVSRRAPVVAVLAVSQTAGLAVLLVVLAVRGGADAGSVKWGLATGLLGLVTAVVFYRALAVGPMSVTAPLSATGAVIPVLVGLFRGERPGAIAVPGLILAFVGVVLASRASEDSGPAQRTGVILALSAAALIGTQMVLLRGTPHTDPLTTVVVTRLVGVVGFSGVAAGTRAVLPRALVPLVIVIGVLDTTANLTLAFATHHGLLSIVSVLSSLFPVMTVVLAHLRLGERLDRGQRLGIGLALTGVLLVVGS